MPVDGGLVRDRLRPLLRPGSPAELLAQQLVPEMDAASYAAIATAITRLLASGEAPN